ncbi:MAG: formimidoylglutamate deiminase [Burkholderiales bacterium]
MSPVLFAPHALLPTGWARDVLLAWDDVGALTRVEPGKNAATDMPVAAGPLIPGLPNLHSHAFQRAFAGLSEHRGATEDSFWTWRDLMYRFARSVSPDQLEDIATHLYIEMLQAGYTSVCEFHYLHHDPAGQRYANPAEMSLRLLSAARRAGIGITLLPVLYQDAGFGGQPARPDQRRFTNSVDALLDIVAGIRAAGARVGIAPHSLRAVGPPALRDVVAGVDEATPIHIHIAEQQQEVQECLAWCGQRPVEWLLSHAEVDARWCLVHATHLTPAERDALVASRAVAGLCPTTEANLGDGLFDAAAYLAAGGAWGVGSDSHASVNTAEELRLLEYGQRLTQLRRNVLAPRADAAVADALWLGAVRGGAMASGRAVAGIAVGQKADFVALDTRHALAGLTPAQALAGHLFANHGPRAVRDVWVAGVRHVRDGEHVHAGLACEQFVAARSALLKGI